MAPTMADHRQDPADLLSGSGFDRAAAVVNATFWCIESASHPELALCIARAETALN
jgi:hypothetical protein